jgi:hypothetical protein
METNVVFIDTEAYVAAKFNYGGGNLKRLADLGASGRLRLLSTDVTAREVESNIREATSAAIAALKRFRDKGSLFRNLPDAEFACAFAEYDEKAIAESLIEQARRYAASGRFTTVEAGAFPAGPVLERYFQNEPPFAPAKKKSEFPDAFVVAALTNWAHSERTTVYLVSKDSGMAAACGSGSPLIHMETIDQLLEQVAAADDLRAWTIAEEAEESLAAEIQADARQQFENLGFYLADQNGDVVEVRASDVRLESYRVIEVDGDRAWVSVGLDIRYVASVSYDDMSTASYDSEDKGYFVHHRIETDVDRSEEVSGTVELLLDLDGGSVELVELTLEKSDVSVVAEEWDYD